MPLWVDHRPRIDFYVSHGLVAMAPTEAQLRKAAKLNFYGAGVIERVRYLARHPLDVFPTAAKKRHIRQSNEYLADRGMEASRSASDIDTALDESLPLFDRALNSLFLFSPARFAVQCVLNPWTPLPATGLHIPTKYLISHLVHAPHPSALWDMQIIHPDPGALDELERQIESAAAGRTLRGRIYRAMAQRRGYYDYLRDLIQRVRRFDYPPSPPGFNPVLENLVDFLNDAARK